MKTLELTPQDLIPVAVRHRLGSIARPVGGRVGPYRLCFELASGGMGTVYLARQQGGSGFERIVAVKQLHGWLRSHDFEAMFIDEARIASRIGHPNVCRVTDFGLHEDRPYLAMEFLRGESLATVFDVVSARPQVRADPRYPRLVARLIAELAEGLHAAHELTDASGRRLHVVHRDVTPHNLFVLYDGTARVTDFGIARSDDRGHHTAVGTLMGKPAYMAPEQLAGRMIDRRADLWSLGVVAWELLTGRRMFPGKSVESVITAITTQPLVRPVEVLSDLDPAIDDAIMRVLDRDPARRFPTARALAEALSASHHGSERAATAAEVSAWLATLFPNGENAIARLIEAALRAGSEAGVPSTEKLFDGVSSTPVLGAPALHERETRRVEAAATRRVSAHPRPASAPPVVPRPARRAPLVAAAALTLALAAVISAPKLELLRATVDVQGLLEAEAAATVPVPEPEPEPVPEPEPEPSPPLPAAAAPKPAKAPSPSPSPRSTPRPAPLAPITPSTPPTGQVVVTTPGVVAQVSLDGRTLARTPASLVLPAGPHHLLVTTPSHADPIPIDVTVVAGRTELVDLALTVEMVAAPPR